MTRPILKLAYSGKGNYSRSIIAELERGLKVNAAGDYNRRMIRRYSTTERALIGAVKWLIQSGYIHDVITVYHEDSSKVYGFVKVTIKGKIQIQWGLPK